MIPTTDKPVFVPKYNPEHGGTDFLGLRIVNVMLMDNCLPGINNVSVHLRPFSLIAWIYWKFHELAAAQHINQPTSKQLNVWKDKIEVLFTWSHVLKGVRGIPGVDARQPKESAVPLDFESWGRNPESTSLMAAIQYGPPAKSPNGLGFVEATESGLFRTAGPGIKLAEALDAFIGHKGPRRLVSELKAATATKSEAKALFDGWSIRTPSRTEKQIFRNVLYSPASTDSTSSTGRRSATIDLVLSVMKAAGRPLTLQEIRESLFFGLIRQPLRPSVPQRLTAAWCRWVVLWVRQAQRIAMECILAWVEERLTNQRDRDTDAMVAAVVSAWSGKQSLLPNQPTVRSIRRHLCSPELAISELLKLSRENSRVSLFDLIEQLRGNANDSPGEQVLRAFRVLFMCAEWVEKLTAMKLVNDELTWGGPERISLRYLHDHFGRCSEMKFKDFVRLFLEQQIISQHLSIAANRYDGGTQRLRITIEEEGLVRLAPDDLPLTVTPDRLYTALSLMSECDLLNYNEDAQTFSTGRFAIAHLASS